MHSVQTLLTAWALASGLLLGLAVRTSEAAPIPGNLQLWLRADFGVTTQDNSGGGGSTTDVNNWLDQAGANNGAQASTTEMPHLVDTQLNGLPVVRFDGLTNGPNGPDGTASAEFLDTSLAAFPNNGAMSVVVAVGAIGSGANQPLLGTDAISGNYGTTYGRVNSKMRVQTQTDASFLPSSNLASNQIRALTRSASNVFNEFLLSGTPTSATRSGEMNVSLVGARRSQFGGNIYLTGDIAEVLVYDKELNSAERIITENYLSSKYATALAGNDYYGGDTSSNFNFDFDVFGVGREDQGPTPGLVTSGMSGSVGLAITAGLDDNEFILAGFQTNNDPAQSAIFLQTNNLNSNESVDLSFDLAGLGLSNAGSFELYFDPSNSNGLQSLGIFGDIDNQTVTFSLAGGNLQTGFYDLVQLQPAPAPEPTSMALLSMGGLILLSHRRQSLRRR